MTLGLLPCLGSSSRLGLALMCVAIQPMSCLDFFVVTCTYYKISLKGPVVICSKEAFATTTASQRGKGRVQWVFTFSLASCLNRCKNSCQKLQSLHISQIRGSHHSLRRLLRKDQESAWLSKRGVGVL